jgi:hypothetical protein
VDDKVLLERTCASFISLRPVLYTPLARRSDDALSNGRAWVNTDSGLQMKPLSCSSGMNPYGTRVLDEYSLRRRAGSCESLAGVHYPVVAFSVIPVMDIQFRG